VVLPLVLRVPPSSGRLVEGEQHGLREDKVDCIQRAAIVSERLAYLATFEF
jgi:hypothetical protein